MATAMSAPLRVVLPPVDVEVAQEKPPPWSVPSSGVFASGAVFSSTPALASWRPASWPASGPASTPESTPASGAPASGLPGPHAPVVVSHAGPACVPVVQSMSLAHLPQAPLAAQ